VRKIKITRLERASLPFLVINKIKRLIKDSHLVPGQTLPSETELANILGVSRGSLREALRILEDEGVILKRHGIGTFITSEVPLVRNPLEINFGVTEIIESTGMRAGVEKLEIERDKASPLVSEKLKVYRGSSIVIVKRVRTANGKPAVYSVDIIPEATLGKINIPPTFSGSLYKFLEEKYNLKVDHGIAKIIPALAEDEICRNLAIPCNSVILLIDQVDYNIENQPVLYSQEYWRRDIFEFTIFRRHR
jgi:GntR family transcriptional regulator